MKYAINYANRVSSETIKETETLDEAKTFCTEFFKGREMYDGDDSDMVSWCRLEVYTLDGDEPNEVFTTEMYWEI